MSDQDRAPQPEKKQRPQSAARDGARRAARKPYASPKLTRHGTIVTVTAVSGDSDSVIFESDRALKQGVVPVDGSQVLGRVAALPISTWSYRGESTRHLGPMAQDFSSAFGLGTDDRHIHVADASGVGLAAIQGLHEIVQAQAARLAALERELATLRESHRDGHARATVRAHSAPRRTTHGTVEAHTAADPGSVPP